MLSLIDHQEILIHARLTVTFCVILKVPSNTNLFIIP
jgi:hypothetical protein